MSKRRRFIIFVVVVILIGGPIVGAKLYSLSQANANIVSSYAFEKVVDGLKKPDSIVQPPGETTRLFVTEQDGKIRIVQDGKILEPPFLDLSGVLTSKELEQGLLAMAFHPKYAENGLFFVTYTAPDNSVVLARYHVSADNANLADPASAKVLLTIEHPFTNHNGGEITFGPDGYLYYGMGDGGSEGDPFGTGQNKTVLLGSMMRLDLDHGDPYAIPADNPFKSDAEAKPELWAKGLRNPWRFSFDSKTGDLYIADVGGSLYEEVDFQAAGSKGGQNYGWNTFEGEIGNGSRAGMTFPIATYNHVTGGCAITGGYVYRGKSLPNLDGVYLYGDFCRGTVWSLKRNASGTWLNDGFLSSGLALSSFGQTNDGEIYAADLNGGIYKLVGKK